MILHAWRDILQSCSNTDDDDLQTKTFFVFAPFLALVSTLKRALGYGRNPTNYAGVEHLFIPLDKTYVLVWS